MRSMYAIPGTHQTVPLIARDQDAEERCSFRRKGGELGRRLQDEGETALQSRRRIIAAHSEGNVPSLLRCVRG